MIEYFFYCTGIFWCALALALLFNPLYVFINVLSFYLMVIYHFLREKRWGKAVRLFNPCRFFAAYKEWFKYGVPTICYGEKNHYKWSGIFKWEINSDK